MAGKKSTTPQFKQSITPFFKTFRKNMKESHRQLKRELSQIASSLREDGWADFANFIDRDIEDHALSTERSIADVKRALSL